MLKPNLVLVLDTNKKPLTPCKAAIARKLLNAVDTLPSPKGTGILSSNSNCRQSLSNIT